MANEAGESLDAKLERGERLIAVWRELSATERGTPGNHNHLSTVFNLGGAGLVIGLCFGSICLGAAIGLYFRLEAREEVMAAERRADMAGLSALMSRVEGVESQVRADRILITKAEQRIAILEPK